jgi:hypothetical protein
VRIACACARVADGLSQRFRCRGSVLLVPDVPPHGLVADRACDDLLLLQARTTRLWPFPAQGKRHVAQVGAWSGLVNQNAAGQTRRMMMASRRLPAMSAIICDKRRVARNGACRVAFLELVSSVGLA